MFANRSLLTIAVAAAVLLAGTVPAAAQTSGTASQTFTATVEVTEDATIVTVEENGSAAADVDVHVDSVGDASYSGDGTHTTDANGQVVLAHPDAETTVELAVESDDVRANGTVLLHPDPAVEGETTVTLSATSAGEVTSDAGDETEINESDEPTESTESNESSTESDDDRQSSGESEDRSAAESQGGFGAQISAFVGSIVDASASIGQDVSAFAQENNPAANDDRPGANASADARANASADAGNASADAGVDAGNASADAGVDASANGDTDADADVDADADASVESDSTVDANTTNGTVNASGNVSVSGNADAGLFGLL